MEYIYAQTPSKTSRSTGAAGSQASGSQTPRKKFDPYAAIDLTLTPPTRATSRQQTPYDDFEIVGDSPPNSSSSGNSAPLSPSTLHNKHLALGGSSTSRRTAKSYGSPKPQNNHYYQPNHPTSTFATPSQVVDMEHAIGHGSFGASISKPAKKPARPEANSYSKYIRPSTGAFGGTPTGQSAFDGTATSRGYRKDGWPVWVDGAVSSQTGAGPMERGETSAAGTSLPRDDPDGEVFDIGAAQITAKDLETCEGDPEEAMRELLAGAVGDGEEGVGEGEEIVEGFAPGMKLMPHQVRGMRWMRERETARRRGGILADDMGLGKTIQALTRIVGGTHTPSEKKVYKGGTLIICPLAVMEQWADEIRQKTKPGLLKVTTHQGPKRAKLAKQLLEFDVVVTTFNILCSEYGIVEGRQTKKPSALASDSESEDEPVNGRKGKKKATTAKRSAPLFDIKWLRVIIDEAQNIKNYKTKAARGACELTAKYRWCLTGTPIQNNVDELYSLFKFLRAKPLDDYQSFKSRVSSQVKAGRTGVAMKRLQIVLKAIMLRRTKTATIDGKPILTLPERNVEVVNCMFNGDERAFYDALEQRTTLTFNKFLANGTAMSNYTSVLAMLLRLRQACDHPSLVTSALAEPANTDPTNMEDVDEELAGMMSGLGVNRADDKAAGPRKCTICYTVIKQQDTNVCSECASISSKKSESSAGQLPSSAKIRTMMELLEKIDERSGGQEKTIIFSQWTSFLDIIEQFLRKAGMKYVRYDGSLDVAERNKVLSAIKTDPTVKIILISFKAGNIGLNLTCCNNVILMEMWWNPALEDQAFDRAHRLGQTRDVNIWKLTIEQTVEDRMLDLQTQKRELADAALNGKAVANMKLTLGDMMQLFARSA